MLVPKVSVVLSDGSTIASALAQSLSTMGSTCRLRSNLQLHSWDGLNEVSLSSFPSLFLGKGSYGDNL